jgi:hypothetical protein
MTPDLLQRAGPAATLVPRAKLGDEARALLRPEWTARQYLDALIAAGHLVDAVRFLAWALPRREAVWWACQCIRAAGLPPGPAEDEAALAAAQMWAASATEDHRRTAFTASEAVNFETPAGLAALAAFWSGGSLAPPKMPVVAPAEHLCPSTVANAIIMAGVLREPEKAGEKYGMFLQLGDDVAQGRNRWKEEHPAGRPPPGRR